MSEQTKIEIKGATVEEAITAGLAKLGVERQSVKITVVDAGNLGILGIGKRDAVVRLTLLSADIQQQIARTLPEATSKVEPVVPTVVNKPVAVNKPQAAKPTDGTELLQLEKECEATHEVLVGLLEMMGIEPDVHVIVGEPDDRDMRTVEATIGGDLPLLTEKNGAVLNALQFVGRAMVSQKLHGRASFVLDANAFRRQREEELRRLAQETADKAIQFQRIIALPPMSSQDRRIVHIALREDSRVETESKGEGENRRVRVMPAGMRPTEDRGSERRQDDRGAPRGGGYDRDRGGRASGGGYRQDRGGSDSRSVGYGRGRDGGRDSNRRSGGRR